MMLEWRSYAICAREVVESPLEVFKKIFIWMLSSATFSKKPALAGY